MNEKINSTHSISFIYVKINNNNSSIIKVSIMYETL